MVLGKKDSQRVQFSSQLLSLPFAPLSFQSHLSHTSVSIFFPVLLAHLLRVPFWSAGEGSPIHPGKVVDTIDLFSPVMADGDAFAI